MCISLSKNGHLGLDVQEEAPPNLQCPSERAVNDLLESPKG